MEEFSNRQKIGVSYFHFECGIHVPTNLMHKMSKGDYTLTFIPAAIQVVSACWCMVRDPETVNRNEAATQFLCKKNDALVELSLK